ncbi:MAG: hypothetical protein OXF04_04765 [bacterium]|nr:hypothetical protein [bacterium]MCY4272639.1 hypothetical protein [bacterium]
MTDLAGDPVFQLNCILWMLQPLPPELQRAREGTGPVAVLHDAGYRLHALGKPLTATPNVERFLAAEMGLKGRPAPDAIASAPSEERWLVVECKKSSFGAQSSTAKQAINLLARADDLSIVAGTAPGGARVGGAVLYATRQSETKKLQKTLDNLSKQLDNKGRKIAPISTLAINVTAGIGVSAQIVGGSLSGPAASAFAQSTLVLPAAGIDEELPRTLYLIPYDPGAVQGQDPSEQSHCLKILLARGRAEAASSIGNKSDTGTTILNADELLSKSTHGLSDYWADHNDRQRAAGLILNFVKEALRDMGKHARTRRNVPNVNEGRAPHRLEITIGSAEQRQACADAVIGYPLPGEPRPEDSFLTELPFADLPGDDTSPGR